MLDARMRRVLDPVLDAVAARLARAGVSADALTLGGFLVGLLAVPLLAFEWYAAALAAIAANRVADGLDGAVARQTGPTERGGFLDIALDFLFYGLVVLGFAMARPENALPAAFLLSAFIGTGATFLAYAAVAARRGAPAEAGRRSRAIHYLGGLTEGTETILVFVVLCLFPAAFGPVAWGFGVLCWLTAGTRLWAGWKDFR